MLFEYRWNTLKSCEQILETLGAEIICFQGKSLSGWLPASQVTRAQK